MRIFSDFHDYYDINLKLSQDESIVYNRKKIKEKIKLDKKFNLGEKWKSYDLVHKDYNKEVPFIAIPKIIGFCGNVYSLLEINYKDQKDFCYNAQQVNNFVNNNLTEKEKQIYFAKESKKQSFTKIIISTKKIKNFFENIFLKETEKKDFFKEHPIFLIDKISYGRDPDELEFSLRADITYNPVLKDYKFFKVFNPVQAFQELQMWKGNIAIPLKEIPKIDDKTMRDIKGFDKMSFKKEKS